MRVIATEEHYYPTEVLDLVRAQTHIFDPWLDTLGALGERRVADMDAAGIDVQLLSMPEARVHDFEDGERALALARYANDETAAGIRAHPDRFVALATLPTLQPVAAADELERTVTEHGFKGGCIPGHVNGRFLDDQYFWPIFERAEALGVPIYLHPREPPAPVMEAYFSGLSEPLKSALWSGGWGWHCETGLHALRLIVGGLFDRFPELQIIIGHMGENLPFSLARADDVLSRTAPHLECTVAEYFQRNFYVTTSGYFTVPPLLCAIEVLGIDRIMFAVDYPLAANAVGRAFLDAAPIAPADREKIAHRNAERLLRI